MQNFRSLDVSGHRARGALASGNFGLGKKHVFWLSKRAKHDPDPLSLRSSLVFMMDRRAVFFMMCMTVVVGHPTTV